MNFLNTFASLFSNFGNLTWQMVVMWGIGALLVYLAIAKKMEPSLLLPMGFGAILVNLPLSGAITQGDTGGPISALFEAGMSNELFPLLLFIGIGAMIDFGPLLEKPWLMLFGAAAQFGIVFTLFLAGFFFVQLALFHQVVHLNVGLDAQHIVEVMLRFDQWHTGQRTFSMHVCLAETCLVHRHLKLFILAPQYFRPMTAVCIDCSSVIKDYAFYICQFTHL